MTSPDQLSLSGHGLRLELSVDPVGGVVKLLLDDDGLVEVEGFLGDVFSRDGSEVEAKALTFLLQRIL